MRAKLIGLILVAIVVSLLFVSCDSSDSSGTSDTSSGAETAAVTETQVDFAVKAVGESLSSIPDGVFQPQSNGGTSANKAAASPGETGLLKGEPVFEGDGITITFEGVSTDPPGMILKFILDDFLPVEGGDESISGEFTLLAGVEMGPSSRVLMVLDTEEGSPITVSGGELDGTTIGFEAFTVYFSLSEAAIDPVGVGGTLLINGMPVDQGMLEGAIPALPVSDGAIQKALETILASIGEDALPDFLEKMPFDTVLDGIKSGEEGGLLDLLPGDGLTEGGVIYEGEGITLTFERFSTEPPGVVFGVTLDNVTPVEDGEGSVSGTFTILVCLDMDVLDPKVRMVLNSEEGAPLAVSGGELDGTTIGFDDFSFFFSLSSLAISPVGLEGILQINGIPVDIGRVSDLLDGGLF